MINLTFYFTRSDNNVDSYCFSFLHHSIIIKHLHCKKSEVCFNPGFTNESLLKLKFCANYAKGGFQTPRITRFFSEVSPSSYFGRTEGLAGNSKPIYNVCDSKSEKSSLMYCFEGTPLQYSAFTWIVGLTNLAQKTLEEK